jgi:hypothetical protein
MAACSVSLIWFLQERRLVDQIAAVAAQHLERRIELGPNGLEQAEALGDGADNGGQIGVVGLVARIGR